MRKWFSAMVVLGLMSVLAFAPVSASAKHIIHLEVTVLPGTTYNDAQVMSKGAILSCAWQSSEPVRFYVTDPEGTTIRQFNGTSGQALIDVEKSGTYTFNWQNTGDETASVIFDKGFLHGEQASSLWIAVLAIAIALIALLIALVVYFAAKSMPKK